MSSQRHREKARRKRGACEGSARRRAAGRRRLFDRERRASLMGRKKTTMTPANIGAPRFSFGVIGKWLLSQLAHAACRIALHATDRMDAGWRIRFRFAAACVAVRGSSE